MEEATKYVKAVWHEADRQCKMRRHATVEKFFYGTLKAEGTTVDMSQQVFQPKRSRPEIPNVPKTSQSGFSGFGGCSIVP